MPAIQAARLTEARAALVAAEPFMREHIAGELAKYADWIERDRGEPDKLLCHVASMRRATFDIRAGGPAEAEGDTE